MWLIMKDAIEKDIELFYMSKNKKKLRFIVLNYYERTKHTNMLFSIIIGLNPKTNFVLYLWSF